MTRDPDDGSSAWAEAMAKEYWAASLQQFKSSYGYKPRAQARAASHNSAVDQARHYEQLAKTRKAEGK